MVVTRMSELSPELLEAEMLGLNNMLNRVEVIRNVASVFEVFDINRFKVYRKADKVIDTLQSREIKPFVFLFNRN